MNEQTIRFRLGVFVLGALLLLAVLIILFGGIPALFHRYNHYTILFNDATGVAAGTPVRRAGVRIGEVESVGLDEEASKARVGIKVESGYSLRKDDVPVLVRGLIGSDVAIDFIRRRPREGPPDTSPVEPGSVIAGGSAPETGDLARQAAGLVAPARETLEEMQKVFARLDKLMPVLEDGLREFRDLAKDGRDTLPTLRDTARSLTKASDRFDGLLRANADKISDSLDRLKTVLERASATFSPENQRNLTESLQRANAVTIDLKKASGPLAERTPAILRNLDEGTDRLNRALGDLRELLRVAGKSEGTLQRFLTDPTLYNRLDEAACMVTRILPRVDRIMQDVEVFADRIARHPESLGLGGVVRPASGLKEAPIGSYYHTPGH
jgi:phospholipid/cholesterol/gamma-HCH transport system substrate-binding protein